MITGNIKNYERYCGIGSDIGNALKLLGSMKFGENPSKMTVNFSELTPSDEDGVGKKKLFEAHRKYIDLHYILEGAEQFGYANIEALLPVTGYSEADDYILLDGEVNRITLREGDFVITFPEDAHIPAMGYPNSKKVKRAVVKIPVSKEETK